MAVKTLQSPTPGCSHPHDHRESMRAKNKVVNSDLGGSCSNLSINRHHLILLACVANNAEHLWLTTNFYDGTIIPSNIPQYHPLGIRDILHITTKTMLSSTFTCPFTPDMIAFISHDTTCNNISLIPSHPCPTSKISLTAGIATFFSEAIIPMTPLE